jgi:hypothetical protein
VKARETRVRFVEFVRDSGSRERHRDVRLETCPKKRSPRGATRGHRPHPSSPAGTPSPRTSPASPTRLSRRPGTPSGATTARPRSGTGTGRAGGAARRTNRNRAKKKRSSRLGFLRSRPPSPEPFFPSPPTSPDHLPSNSASTAWRTRKNGRPGTGTRQSF